MKRLVHYVGSVVAIAGILFVALRLRDYSGQINFTELSSRVWWVVGGCALVYGFSNTMLALAWWNLLQHFGAATSLRWASRTYGVSQLAKYVPGNIFHLAGRQAIGMAAGVPSLPLVKSSFWEIGLLAIAGATFSILTLPLFFPPIARPIEVGLFALAILGIATSFKGYFGVKIARAFGWYVGFLALSGVLFVCLLATLQSYSAEAGVGWVTICGSYIIAWLIGLVTPGSPAGIGVRELVLVFLLSGSVDERELFLAAMIARIVTVFGDLLFFSIALTKNKGS